MNEAQRQRFIELTREDETARSTVFVAAVNSLEVSQYVLTRNFVEIFEVLEAFDRDHTLTNVERRSDANDLHLEFVRRLHNYLAAAKMLVDHTRGFRSRWPHPALDLACKTRTTALSSEPVVKFVQDLRHPTLHARLPAVARVTTFAMGADSEGDPPEKTRLMVDVSELDQLYDWSALGRTYIAQSATGGKLDLGLAIGRYQERVRDFTKWFSEAVLEAHADLVADFRARRAEIRRLLGAGDKEGGLTS